jgi:hypothetical protein
MAEIDFRDIRDGLRRAAFGVVPKAEEVLQEVGDAIVKDMKELVPVDTGALKNSIRCEVETENKEVSCYIYADAKSRPPKANESEDGEDGKNKETKPFTPVPYAEFVEYGTGKQNEKGDGRQTPWWYQDSEGKWHKTTGNRPHPFIRPALVKNERNLDARVGELVDISKYKK